ncbi:MAG: hypothetical protein IKN90_03505 [Treponema sp.]|nr:hypothetical protein [Treponema sp.]
MLVRFRRLFSTDKIIEKAREIMDNMLMDLNRNAERNVGLVNDSIKMLKDVQEETLQVQQEAERRIALMNGEIEASKRAMAFEERISGKKTAENVLESSAQMEVKVPSSKSRRGESKKSVASRKSTEKTASRTRTKVADEGMDPLFQTNVVVDSPASDIPQRVKGGSRSASLASRYRDEQAQGNLFSADTTAPVQPATSEERPSGQPEIVHSSNPVVVKKSINRQVQEYAALGMTEEEIASKLGRTVQEIKLMLEFI